MGKTKEELTAEKLEKEKADKLAALEAEKLEKEKADKLAAEKQLSKNKYEVAVTGFLALGKMFRPDTKIEYNQYKKYIKTWLEEGKIRIKK